MDLDIKDLKESNDFLNDLYGNVTTAIFLADKEARLAHFNDAFKALFYKPEDQLLGELCGNAIGCSFVTDEGVDCGSTSNCDRCELRTCIIKSFTEHVPVYKMPLVRDFEIGGRLLRKHFSFTTKYATYLGEEYVLVLVDDVTDLAEARASLARRNSALEATLRALAQELTDNSRQLVLVKESSEELGRELRHRVGNTLQILSALLQFEDADENSEARAFKNFSLRLETIIEAYRHTRYEEGSVTIPLDAFIRSLAGKTADCVCAGDGSGMDGQRPIALDVAIPLGLAVVELLSLARRKTTGGVTVETRIERRFVTVIIRAAASCFSLSAETADDEAPDGMTQAGVPSNSQLARAMVDQLKGDLHFRDGREAWLRFPM